MSEESLVEIADRKSRQRAVLFAFAALVFLLVQVVVHPAFGNEAYARGWRAYSWAFTAGVLLLCVGGGGGWLNAPRLRALIHDEVARTHNRQACTLAFWVAMIAGLLLNVVPAFRPWTGHQVSYVLVTLGTATALLLFAWLEYRAHADA